MVTITLDAADAITLADALKSYLSDLGMEIADTDNKDFRDGLKARKAALRRVLDLLETRAA